VILYLHGFRSSPQSVKARLIANRCAQLDRAADYLCPQLPVAPAAAAASIFELAVPHGGAALTVIGSSLGGYYATWLAERVECRVVLLNPAIRPQRDLAAYLGRQTVYYSSDTVEIEPAFLTQLETLWVPEITRAQRYFLIAAKGDELLDWREMVERYPGARHLVLEGSDHGISDFPRYLDEVMNFAGITRAGSGKPGHGGSASGQGGCILSQFDATMDPGHAQLSPSVQKVARVLEELGVHPDIVITAESARTAQQAADVLGVDVAQIAKSLIFRGSSSGRGVLVIAAGDNRVDEEKVKILLGESIERASAEFVRQVTGFAIGGVAPVGYPDPLTVLCDDTLARFEVVWAAAGSPHAVFSISPADLFRVTGARVADVRRS
jgi:predicted esterase YcpF (UPF0227 family)/prolyl-tRNA editing enzyme YbaK/EbsC (Cys-tRNA(Pro) deacylase)